MRCVPGSPAIAPYCSSAYVFSAVKRLRVPSRLLACVFSRNTVTRLCFYAHCNACLYLQSVALVITVVVCVLDQSNTVFVRFGREVVLCYVAAGLAKSEPPLR